MLTQKLIVLTVVVDVANTLHPEAKDVLVVVHEPV